MTRCIGIDPAYAKPIAYAHRMGPPGERWVVGAVDPDDMTCLADVLRDAKKHGCMWAVIEDCYLGKNAATHKGLAKMQGQLVTLAALSLLRVRLVPPSRWQVDCLTQGTWRPKTHAEIVTAAKFRARGLTGTDWSEDKAVAVCLADWGDCHLSREMAHVETP